MHDHLVFLFYFYHIQGPWSLTGWRKDGIPQSTHSLWTSLLCSYELLETICYQTNDNAEDSMMAEIARGADE